MSQPPGWMPPQGGDQPPPTWGGAPPPAAGPPGYGGYGGWARPDFRPGVIPLRPLGVGEILDGALTTIRQYPKATLGLSAIVVAISQLLQFGFLATVTPRLAAISATGEISSTDVTRTFSLLFATLLVDLLAGLVLSGMLVVVLGQAVLGRPISAGEVWERSRGRLGPLVGAALLTGLLVAVGAILCIAPGVYAYVALALATPALMLEGQRVTGALRRSSELVRGAWWRTFGILLLAVLIAGVLESILSAPFALLSSGPGTLLGRADPAELTTGRLAVQSLGAIVAGTVVAPFSAGVTALIYVDRRIRVEGLDVALARAAAQDAGSPPRSGDPTPPSYPPVGDSGPPPPPPPPSPGWGPPPPPAR